MYRLALLLFVSLLFGSCSPIQTVQGLGQHSISLKTNYVSPGGGGDRSADYGGDRYEGYNASIAKGGDDPSDIQANRCGEFYLVDNGAVQHFIDYFTAEGKSIMRRILERSNRYVALMASILYRYGHPEILAYVPIIESGFLSNAQSKKKAIGFWQFMSETAGDYDLRMNRYVDERQDPELSTIGAAKYLTVLCSTFESWPLALAGYNAGQKRINDIILYSANRNFWELAKKGRLPDETMEYIPKIMAALRIAQSPSEYGFYNLKLAPPMEFRLMRVSKRSYFSDISERHGFSYEELRELNPMFKTNYIPGTGNSSHIRIPL